MREIYQFRINYDYAHLLFRPDEGRDLGGITKSVKVVFITREDPRFCQIPIVAREVKEKYGRAFFFYWEIKRKYSKTELDRAEIFHMKIKATFEPAGEEYGTVYDETVACEICGANRKQVGPLMLKKSSIPKKDIARTIAGEVVVSEKFASAIRQNRLKGILLKPVILEKRTSKFYQLSASSEVKLSRKTVVGKNPFDLSTDASEAMEFTVSGGYRVKFEKEVYICPKGHLIGLNLLSEPYVLNAQTINHNDFFASQQKVGVKRGLLRPEPLYLCSPKFRKMVKEEKLTGFDFEIARVE